MDKLKVYIAGPYTIGDVAANVSAAMEAWHDLADHGFAPFCPHLCHFLHLQRQRKYADWMALDEPWLRCCDAVLRLVGKSHGADCEVRAAKRLGIPVFRTIQELREWRAMA